MSDNKNYINEDKSLLWEEKAKKAILKTPIMTIEESESVASDGLKRNYILIDAPDWVTVIPVSGDNFIMVKQWRHGEKSVSTEFPGGVIESGETPLQGAERELKEETGCIAGKMVYLGSVNPNPAFMQNHFHVYAAFDINKTGKQSLDEDEYVNYLEIEKSEVYKRMGTKEMPHALMVAALELFRQHYEQ